MGAYSFSAWNAVGVFTMQALNKVFGTPYEPPASSFFEQLDKQGVQIKLSHKWV